MILIRLQQRMWWLVSGVWLNHLQQRLLSQVIIQQRKVDHKLERTFIIEQIPKIIATMEAQKMLKEMSVEISHQVLTSQVLSFPNLLPSQLLQILLNYVQPPLKENKPYDKTNSQCQSHMYLSKIVNRWTCFNNINNIKTKIKIIWIWIKNMTNIKFRTHLKLCQTPRRIWFHIILTEGMLIHQMRLNKQIENLKTSLCKTCSQIPNRWDKQAFRHQGNHSNRNRILKDQRI